MGTFEIRDRRDKNWFYLDNEYLNSYARIFGPIGTAIYVSLCRHADNTTQQCFPSVQLIAEELNIGTTAVKKYLKKLAEWQIIRVDRQRDPETKKWERNVYTLLKKSVWQKPGTRSDPGMPGTPGDKVKQESQGRQESHNNTHIINKTHIAKQASPTVDKVLMNRLIEAIARIQKYEPKGAEWNRYRKAVKELITSGRTESDILACASALQRRKEGFGLSWTPQTIVKEMPAFLAGEFGKSRRSLDGSGFSQIDSRRELARLRGGSGH